MAEDFLKTGIIPIINQTMGFKWFKKIVIMVIS